MVIRIATMKDLDQMVVLWEELMRLHEPMHPAFKLHPNAIQLARLELAHRIANPVNRFLVCDMGKGKLAGMIATQHYFVSSTHQFQHHGYIAETIIASAYRHQGIGARLVDAARQWLHGMGVSFIELQVAPMNEAAMQFWKSQGFSTITEHLMSPPPADWKKASEI